MREKGLGRKKPLTILLQIEGIGISGVGIAEYNPKGIILKNVV